MKYGSTVRCAALVLLTAAACADEANAPARPEAPQSAVTHDHGDDGHSPGQEDNGFPGDARVIMVSPRDGEVIRGPLVHGRVSVGVEMGLEQARLAPAGHVEEGTGHHHVIVDAGPLPAGEPVPFDEQHLHFGQGQTRVQVQLTPGRHRLTLQFADGAHRSYGPQLATSIEIWVVAE